ncbi:uncharacterized protein LOC135471497 isoform X1 [Liolophura sinensis]|uniref:uncharacterized protein LOC135471497 isoform X1 n=1 Tax=Liolophura sinensis TaxID=3198878 RepID=UPI003158D401
MKTSTQWDSMYMKFLELEENALQQRQLQVRKTRKTVICCTLIQLQNKDVQTRVELWTMKASCLLLVWGEHSNNVSELSSEIIRSTTDRILESEEAASLNQEGSSLSQQDLPIFPVQMGQSVSPGANSDALAWHGWTFGAFITPGSVNPDFVKAEAAAASKPSEKLHVHKPFRYGVPSKVCRGQGRGTGPNSRDERTSLSSCPDKNSRSSATIFERWLNSCSGRYSRSRVETIPPEDLDGLLADFLAVVKKTSGGDYDAVSFSNLRYNLDRYLSAKGYGHVISKSPLFGRSQAVFNSRRSQLKAKATKSGGPLTFTSPPTLIPQPDEQQSLNSGSEENAQESS